MLIADTQGTQRDGEHTIFRGRQIEKGWIFFISFLVMNYYWFSSEYANLISIKPKLFQKSSLILLCSSLIMVSSASIEGRESHFVKGILEIIHYNLDWKGINKNTYIGMLLIPSVF